MKKWLLFFAMSVWMTTLLSQGQAIKNEATEIYDEAFRHLKGIGRSYDPARAVELFKQAADMGNSASLNALGNLYANGEAGLPSDIKMAIEYYQRAGKGGHSIAYYNLASLYKDDKVVAQDFQISAGYAKAGSDLGDLSCKRLLAYYYFKGFGIQQNYTQAFRLYNEVAQRGDVNAQYFLGLCYRNGYGTKADQNEARKWLSKAAARGDYQATHELTQEPRPENSNIYNPDLQQQVESVRAYQERLVAANTNDISGIYKGIAIYYDFSGKFVHQVRSLSLTMLQTSRGYEGTWTEDDSENATVTGTFTNNYFSFEPGSQYTRRNYYSYRDAEVYQFKSAKLAINYVQDSVRLVGNMQFYSLSRKEPGQPMFVVLSRKVYGNQNHAGEKLELTATPNPVITELRATFTLQRPARVTFEIIDITGKPVSSQVGQALLPPGKYSMPIEVRQLVQGSYSIRVLTSTGLTESKLFIKQ